MAIRCNSGYCLSPKVKDTGILTVISPQERKRQEVRIRLIASD